MPDKDLPIHGVIPNLDLPDKRRKTGHLHGAVRDLTSRRAGVSCDDEAAGVREGALADQGPVRIRVIGLGRPAEGQGTHRGVGRRQRRGGGHVAPWSVGEDTGPVDVDGDGNWGVGPVTKYGLGLLIWIKTTD